MIDIMNVVYAEQEADHLGINMENTFTFEASNEGVVKMYNMVHEAVFEKRVGPRRER